MFKLGLEKAEEPKIKLPASVGSQKKQGNSRKTSTFTSLTTQKPLTVSIITVKSSSRDGNTRPPHLPQLELDMEQQTGSNLGKEYVKAIYDHHACLTYMQSTSCKMPGCMNHKLQSKLPREMTTSDMQIIPL